MSGDIRAFGIITRQKAADKVYRREKRKSAALFGALAHNKERSPEVRLRQVELAVSTVTGTVREQTASNEDLIKEVKLLKSRIY